MHFGRRDLKLEQVGVDSRHWRVKLYSLSMDGELSGCRLLFAADTELVKSRLREWRNATELLIRDSDDNINLGQLYMLPVGFRWGSKPGVTLLVDTARLNLALADALELSRSFRLSRNSYWTSHKAVCGIDAIADALREYNSAISSRAAEAAKKI